MLIAKMYELMAADGVFAIIHNWTVSIQEIWVPQSDKSFCFNSKGYVFFSNKPRTTNDKIVDIELRNNDVIKIRNFLYEQEEIEEIIKQIFSVETL